MMQSAIVAQEKRADPSKRYVYQGPNGALVYEQTPRGDRIPDYSYCGYRGGGADLPSAKVQVVVQAPDGDSTDLIQSAIDEVAKMPADSAGLRGAILLGPGRFQISKSIRIGSSGIVLRGSGVDVTWLIATGTSRRTLVNIAGTKSSTAANREVSVRNSYIPVGSTTLDLADYLELSRGDEIRVRFASRREWVRALGMDRFPSRDTGSWLDWRPGTMDLVWVRDVHQVNDHRVELEAPLTCGLDSQLGDIWVSKSPRDGMIRNVGIENMTLESEYDRGNHYDEEHAWNAIHLDFVCDAWVREISVRHFAGSAVAVWEGARRISICDLRSTEPKSEIGGERRQTYFSVGQQILFLRCRADDGRHDFSVGHLATGPTAFVHCTAESAHQFSGPIGSWACGVLYDQVDMDGGGLALTNRETAAQGTGWSAANCMLWNCTAPLITCRNPPTAQNWAIGVWGEYIGDGNWRQLNEFADPDSLYEAQLIARLGRESRRALARKDFSHDDLENNGRSVWTNVARPAKSPANSHRRLSIVDGRLILGDEIAQGKRLGTVWWRGSVLPSRATELGVGVTRFVPGRTGLGYTDDLDELTDAMLAQGQIALDHHWGLWYDRRRDDHQMIRRIDGEVWPPFYESPWARSGTGKAWDGLSKYDLEKFNPWYFSRLREFADHCDRKGLILIQQMYFQHNVLEAGAHWADFPWRPANCLNDTGMPEPPPYVNRKRIFLANEFYDVAHLSRRKLHRNYIRKCLDALGSNSNVIFMTGEEFTGPLSFVQFWLSAIDEWQRETGRNVLVGLSCTKDVQDAILEDPRLNAIVDVIDLKYWWYTANGELYAPSGGQQLAPRQQLREWKGSKKTSDEQLDRQIREYRQRFPTKAVMSSLPFGSSETILRAGGSLPKSLPAVSIPIK